MNTFHLTSPPGRAVRYGMLSLGVVLLSALALVSDGIFHYALFTLSILPVIVFGLWPELRDDPEPVVLLALIATFCAFNGIAYLRPLLPAVWLN